MDNILIYCPRSSMAKALYDLLVAHNYNRSQNLEGQIRKCGKNGILIAINESRMILYGTPPVTKTLRCSWNCYNYSNDIEDLLKERGFIE